MKSLPVLPSVENAVNPMFDEAERKYGTMKKNIGPNASPMPNRNHYGINVTSVQNRPSINNLTSNRAAMIGSLSE
jgi:hypothetical protein